MRSRDTGDVSPEGGDTDEMLTPERRSVGRRTALTGTWLPVLVPTVIVLVGAWGARWVTEDAFINFRIIGNLLAGHGPVFNVGERVEAYTDPLWVGVLAMLRTVCPIVSVEWWSVILGLVCTAVGFLFGGRAAQRLAGTSYGIVLPIGLLMVSVVDGVWDFATSGLEMGMVFSWLGLTWWLLVRAFEKRSGSRMAAFVAGLGPLIRPELALMAVIFLGALAVVVGSRDWQAKDHLFSRWIQPLACAAALPVAYEIWRMAYFALVIPNTGLAKSAGSSWWSQGFVYLKDFFLSDAVWLPLVFAAFIVTPAVLGSLRQRDRVRAAVLSAPLAAGLVDVLYVGHVGGDFMHARMLLPAFFSIGLSIWIAPRDWFRRWSWMAIPAIVIVTWSLVCLSFLRYPAMTQPAKTGIANERAYWVSNSRHANPINVSDYNYDEPHLVGSAALEVVRSISGGKKIAIRAGIGKSDYAPLLAGRSNLPFKLAVPFGDIGTSGVVAGPSTYVFDGLSLANPIGSHTKVLVRGRPGHEKSIGPVWELARFGDPNIQSAPGITKADLSAARRALSCNPLAAYLRAITSRLTLGRALSNIAHATTFTRMSFNADPTTAAQEFCNGG